MAICVDKSPSHQQTATRPMVRKPHGHLWADDAPLVEASECSRSAPLSGMPTIHSEHRFLVWAGMDEPARPDYLLLSYILLNASLQPAWLVPQGTGRRRASQ
jgi:hypothetical protein